MTRETQLAEIRRKCIEANPEDDRYRCDCNWCVSLTIHLADILLAIVEHCKDTNRPITAYRNFKVAAIELLALYNLRADDLTLQSDPTISFIYDLLK